MKSTKTLSIITASLLVIAVTPAIAADTQTKNTNSTIEKNDSKKKHCDLDDVAQKCCESEKGAIHCIDDLIKTLADAKVSKKKKDKDQALDKALSVLEKLKKNSEATVCAMETIKYKNKLLKGKVQKIKKEMSVLESMFNTPASDSFMSGPYF